MLLGSNARLIIPINAKTYKFKTSVMDRNGIMTPVYKKILYARSLLILCNDQNIISVRRTACTLGRTVPAAIKQ